VKWHNIRARARPNNSPGMNKLESDYASQLELRRMAGEILWWKYEGMKFRLANNTFYTPDFDLMLSDGTVEIHEVKGHWEDDARVKIKVAASLYPFSFKGIQRRNGQWIIEDFHP
jgi:hypothetical protein